MLDSDTARGGQLIRVATHPEPRTEIHWLTEIRVVWGRFAAAH